MPDTQSRHAILFELIRQQNLTTERAALFTPAKSDESWQEFFTKNAVKSLGM